MDIHNQTSAVRLVPQIWRPANMLTPLAISTIHNGSQCVPRYLRGGSKVILDSRYIRSLEDRIEKLEALLEKVIPCFYDPLHRHSLFVIKVASGGIVSRTWCQKCGLGVRTDSVVHRRGKRCAAIICLTRCYQGEVPWYVCISHYSHIS